MPANGLAESLSRQPANSYPSRNAVTVAPSGMACGNTPIWFVRSGMTIETRPAQEESALPMFVTLFGITTSLAPFRSTVSSIPSLIVRTGVPCGGFSPPPDGSSSMYAIRIPFHVPGIGTPQPVESRETYTTLFSAPIGEKAFSPSLGASPKNVTVARHKHSSP